MKKRILILALITLLVLAFALQDNLIRTYVSLCHEDLESYAVNLLKGTEEPRGTSGIWETHCYPEDGMVEFYTGGWGLVPSSTYKGFYYSADNTHKLFSAAYSDQTSMEIDGDRATWTDGTDNHGSSTRIIDHWFWFKASF